MAQSSNFDPKELFSDVINFVRERSQATGNRASANVSEPQLDVAILSALAIEPRNAAGIKDFVALASGGVVSPTASQVRTVVDALVEEQKVKVETKGDRKVFEITKAGKDALASARGDMKENATETGETSDKSASESSAKSTGWDSVFIVAASKLGPVLLDVAQTGSRDQQKRATEILAETRHQLHQILAEK